jgi:Phosphoglycerol transferase and related proteins, alkaline phosphatase superfamily
MYSLNKFDDFGSQYQFFDKDEAASIFEQQNKHVASDSITSLLHSERPNIILFMLESFSYDVAMDSVIAPNMSRLAKEGVLFDNFYANSFRTDRGIVSILSGYPAHPTEAILKHPRKTESLPSIPKSLRKAGYANQSMYYGGDIQFANMLSYIVGSCGIQDVISDKDFPVRERLTKWGVPDQPLLDRLYRDLTEKPQQEPFCKVVLTLSSHEPFDVPVDTFDVPFLNSVNYTDKCIGDFVSALKKTELWDNTLVVFLADHAMQSYPQGTNNYEKSRFKIPMLWVGGSIKQPLVVEDFGSQNDLAATLLSQLNVDYSDYKFSKDILDWQGAKFSFYSYVNGFCMMDSSNIYIYDNNLQKSLEQTGNPNMEKQAKAYFQMMYLDLGER